MPPFGQGRGVVGADAPGVLRLSLLLLGLPKAATHQDIGLFDGARSSLDFGNAAQAAVWEATSTSGHASSARINCFAQRCALVEPSHFGSHDQERVSRRPAPYTGVKPPLKTAPYTDRDNPRNPGLISLADPVMRHSKYGANGFVLA